MMKVILRKKKIGREISFPRQHYKAIIIKTVWYWHKTDIGHWNSIESPEINPQTSHQSLTVDKKPGSLIGGSGKTGKIHVKE